MLCSQSLFLVVTRFILSKNKNIILDWIVGFSVLTVFSTTASVNGFSQIVKAIWRFFVKCGSDKLSHQFWSVIFVKTKLNDFDLFKMDCLCLARKNTINTPVCLQEVFYVWQLTSKTNMKQMSFKNEKNEKLTRNVENSPKLRISYSFAWIVFKFSLTFRLSVQFKSIIAKMINYKEPIVL